MDEIIKKADVLIEALPYVRAFRHKTVVIKYGGSAMGDEDVLSGILEDVVFLSYVGIRPVMLHGGGPDISERMRAAGHPVEFVDGYRVTTAAAMGIVRAALGELNQRITMKLVALGGQAMGVQSDQEHLFRVRKVEHPTRDLGFVGEVLAVNPHPIHRLTLAGTIPVLTPIGIGHDGQAYNVNADQVSAEAAVGLAAEKLVVLTDTQGILLRRGEPESLLSTVDGRRAQALIEAGVIRGGMVPKVRACIRAVEQGVRKTHIIDARIPHALLLEIFTDRGIGTEIVREGTAAVDGAVS